MNGAVVDVLLFGGFLVWAIADRASFKHRPQIAVVLGKHPLRNDLIVISAGLTIYAAFILGVHQALFGVSPL